MRESNSRLSATTPESSRQPAELDPSHRQPDARRHTRRDCDCAQTKCISPRSPGCKTSGDPSRISENRAAPAAGSTCGGLLCSHAKYILMKLDASPPVFFLPFPPPSPLSLLSSFPPSVVTTRTVHLCALLHNYYVRNKTNMFRVSG